MVTQRAEVDHGHAVWSRHFSAREVLLRSYYGGRVIQPRGTRTGIGLPNLEVERSPLLML